MSPSMSSSHPGVHDKRKQRDYTTVTHLKILERKTKPWEAFLQGLKRSHLFHFLYLVLVLVYPPACASQQKNGVSALFFRVVEKKRIFPFFILGCSTGIPPPGQGLETKRWCVCLFFRVPPSHWLTNPSTPVQEPSPAGSCPPAPTRPRGYRGFVCAARAPVPPAS